MKEQVRIALLSFIVIGLLFFVVNRVFFFSPTIIETLSSIISYPVLLFQRAFIAPIHRHMEKKSTIAALQQEVGALLLERDELRAQNVILSAALSFADQTAEVREFKERYSSDRLQLAHILMRHIAEDAHYLLVDAGENKLIEPGMVAVYKNCLIGRVVEVFTHFCKVQLISDPSCKVAACCINSGIHGIYQGTGSLSHAELTHVSHLLQLKGGDEIISSGEGLVFPEGFGLGVIESFEPHGLYYKVIVRSFINIHVIDYCYLMRQS